MRCHNALSLHIAYGENELVDCLDDINVSVGASVTMSFEQNIVKIAREINNRWWCGKLSSIMSACHVTKVNMLCY